MTCQKFVLITYLSKLGWAPAVQCNRTTNLLIKSMEPRKFDELSLWSYVWDFWLICFDRKPDTESSYP